MQKRAKRNKAFKPSKNPFIDPLFDVHHPVDFAEPLDNKIKYAVEFSQTAGKIFQSNLDRIHEELLECNPLHLLSSLSHYHLLAINGTQLEKVEEDPILQHHLELILSLALKHKFDEYKGYRKDPSNLLNTIKETSHLFYQKRLCALASTSSDAERKKLSVKESVRIHTQAVRNWGYPQHMKYILTKLVLPLDVIFKDQHGITASGCVTLLFDLVAMIEERITDFETARHTALKPMPKSSMLQNVRNKFPYCHLPDETEKFCKDPSISKQQFRNHLICSLDTILPLIYGFSPEHLELLSSETTSNSTMKKLLGNWSLQFGEISTEDEHLFMGSPIRQKPIVKFDDELFIAIIPGLLLSYSQNLIEALFDQTDTLKLAYENRRAKFLEDELSNLLKANFPDSSIFKGSLWHSSIHDPTVYENDILMVIDCVAIIFEAKAGRFKDSARRGGERLISEIKALLIEPAQQAIRFAHHLKTLKGIQQFDTKSGTKNNVNIDAIKYIIPIAITLDDLKPSEGWSILKEAGIAPPDLPEIPIYTLADLLAILDLLSGQTQRIHYLLRRAQFDPNLSYLGDELDRLVLYMKTRFWYRVPGATFHGIGEADIFNAYYQKTYDGLKEAKPELPLSFLWNKLLKTLEMTKPNFWTTYSNMLLNADYRQQIATEKLISKFIKKHKRSKESHSLHTLSVAENTETIIFLVYSSSLQSTPQELLQVALNEFRHTQVLSGTAIFVDCEKSKSESITFAPLGEAVRTNHQPQILGNYILDPLADNS
jgi:hypothetical protein